MKLILLLLTSSFFSFGQNDRAAINSVGKQLDSIESLRTVLRTRLEELSLDWVQDEIVRVGVPKTTVPEEVITHSAMSLSYNEKHEQANWVMHVITPDIVRGNESRSNDFRVDSMISTGSSVEEDFFLKKQKADGSYDFDGFGYDRGHLAPSADFRWSEKALSESFFYSNMSPQLADFNRLKWAELEGWMREYVTKNTTDLIIVTAPVLTDDLLKVERSVHKVSIPKYFVKVAIDIENKRGVGFVLPHEKIENPLESYVVSIDSVEKLLGYDFFSNLDDNLENALESQDDYSAWLPTDQENDVRAIALTDLPKNAVNTTRVKGIMNDNRRHTVCGKVVSTKKHKKGHVFIDLDKKFPNQVFSVSIFQSNIKNFDYEPEVYLLDQEVCFTGTIGEYNDVPNMIIDNGKQVKLFGEY